MIQTRKIVNLGRLSHFQDRISQDAGLVLYITIAFSSFQRFFYSTLKSREKIIKAQGSEAIYPNQSASRVRYNPHKNQAKKLQSQEPFSLRAINRCYRPIERIHLLILEISQYR